MVGLNIPALDIPGLNIPALKCGASGMDALRYAGINYPRIEMRGFR